MNRAMIVFLIVAACCAMPVAGSAESLSDLNLQGFEQKKSEVVTPARSPFVPQQAGKEELLVQDLRLTGVAYREGEAYALVSGNVVTVGDRLGGYRVSSIERHRVVLRKLDETVVLRLEGTL
ncbi:MAG: hypothetical protein HYV03_03355 [Deltaproteobacteria bacterium]|nr:hypothetical protein [Deltaproteobacteria bacterium]